jgi:hypothetical protein
MAKLLSGTQIYGTATIDTQLFINGTTSATSTVTGALRVIGGVGIGGSLHAGNIFSNGALISGSSTGTTSTFVISNTTSATSTITGALQVIGGVGIGGSLYAGNIFSNGTLLTPGSTITNDNATNTTQYIGMSRAISGSWTTAYVSDSKLYFNPSSGTLNSTIFNSLSDISRKTNIHTITNAVNTVNSIEGSEFTWVDNGKKSAGVVAQQLEKVLPWLIDTGENGLKSVNYNGIIGYLINAVKELDARVRQLEDN